MSLACPSTPAECPSRNSAVVRGAAGCAASRRGFPRASRTAGLALALVFAISSSPAAEDDKVIFPGSSAKSETVSAPKSSSLNTMTLGIALVLAGVGGWLVWRNRRGGAGVRGAQALAVEETRALGNRQYLVVASYEGKKFLLGVCPGQINLLSPLTPTSHARASDE